MHWAWLHGHEPVVRHTRRAEGKNFSKNLQLVETVKKIAEKHHATPAQIAIAWTLHKGNNFVPIPGTKRLKYLEENSSAGKIHGDVSNLVEI